MNPYSNFVAGFANLMARARQLPLGGIAPTVRPEPRPGAPKALFFAPHPDDECISGGPAVRLQRESGMEVINAAVTLGSNQERKAGRLAELRDACGYLGFQLATTGPLGLERITLKARAQEPAHWAASVAVIRDLLVAHQPAVVILPHARDWNGTHIGTHHLVTDALAAAGPDFECLVIETEFWGAMDDPNLMLELSQEDLTDMITATTFHVGEVARNPYHLLLPGWTMDNVRRGSELVGGQGGAAPDFQFAVLCRAGRWRQGRIERAYAGGRQLASGRNLLSLFEG